MTPIGVFFGSDENDADLETFKIVANTHEKVLFAHTFAPEARTHYNLEENVKVVLFKSFEEKRNDFTGSTPQHLTLLETFEQ